MNDFRNWYIRYQDNINWFVIGWLAFAMLDNLGRGSYGWAALDAALIYINYNLGKMQ